MTIEEAEARKTKLIALRTEAETALSSAYGAQSYSVLGRSKNNVNATELKKHIEDYTKQIDELDRIINGEGGLKVSYGIP